MNILKLKGKMVETEHTMDGLALEIGVDRSTLYRKMECGEKFTVGEVQKIKMALSLNNEELTSIFFD